MSDFLETLFSLRGKVALVTGASRGIGAAIAHALSAAGAHTVGLGRSPQPTGEFSANAEYRQCDILDSHQFSSVCASVFETNGRLDILVNAAGITLPKSEGDDALQNFGNTIATNLVSVHHCCQIAANYMKRNDGGSIVKVPR